MTTPIAGHNGDCHPRFVRRALLANLLPTLIFCGLALAGPSLLAQGTTFTYQGRLNDGTAPASGSYDLQFSLYDASVAGTLVGGPVTSSALVSNGLFTVVLDFGANPFAGGASRWLQIGVRTNGGAVFALLSPLQQLTATPYSITAGGVTGPVAAGQLSGALPSGGLSGTYPGAVNLGNPANSFTGAFVGNGSGLSNVNASFLGGLPATNFWQLGGNNVGMGQFLGSLNNQPLEILVNGQRALRFETTSDTANIIGGWSNNFAAAGVVMATIGGGGGASLVNGSLNTNSVWSDYGTVGGGLGNQAGTTNDDPAQVRGATVSGGGNNTAGALYSTVAGGTQNTIALGADMAVIAGGYNNTIQATSAYSAIGGGYQNRVDTNAFYAGIGSGYQNHINSNASDSWIGGGVQNSIFGNPNGGGSISSATVGGGYNNVIQTNSSYATIAGGVGNTIEGSASSAAISGGSGNRIQATSSYSAISGGGANVVQAGASYGSIGGGRQNVIATGTANGTIGGGYSNYVNGISGTVAGGEQNQATAFRDTVGGGIQNTASGGISTVAGGWTNIASGNGSVVSGGGFNVATSTGATVAGGQQNAANGIGSAVPGGYNNIAAGNDSFAAGQQAQALHNGAFVWADTQNAPFASTANDQFNVRAAGGVRLVTGGAGFTLDGLAVVTSGPGDLNLGTSSSLPGGVANTIQSGADRATISGGNANQIAPSAGATIGGGIGNTVGTNSNCSTIAGGNYNSVLNNSAQASIGGGLFNTNGGFAATVPGGYLNMASGSYSFAAGDRGEALHSGAFVWADSQGVPFASTASDQFLLRARGGVGIGTASTPEGNLSINTNSYLFSHTVYLRGETGTDHNHGLAYCGSGHTNFATGVLPDGPVLWGFGGGALGAMNGGAHALLNWNSTSVNIGYSGDGQTSPPAFGVSGNRGTGYPLALVHNLYPANILQAGPALRVINDGNSPDGALSVSTQGTGLIARFGNASTYVADIQTNGTIDAVVFNSTSDRNAKEHFEPVDSAAVLERVAALPISEWNYKQAEGIRHIGPMAQDFQAAFRVGADDKHIATVDADGVALAAIQGLNRKLEQEVKEKDAELRELKTRLDRLEQLLNAKASEH